MKVCPFCKEEIRDEAIKCRFCGSSLLPVQPENRATADTGAAPPGTTTYVVDEGLVRFGKFAMAILAIFVVVGVVLYGTDVKQSAKDASDSKKEAEASQKQAQQTLSDIQKTKEEIFKDRLTLEKQLSDAQAALALAHASQQSVVEIEKRTHDLKSQIDLERQDVIADQKRINDYLRSIQKDVATAHSLVNSQPENQESAEFTSTSHSVREVAGLYGLPKGFDGKGQKIGLIELGGGFDETDIQKYFKDLNLPMPNILVVPVDGASNKPGTPGDSQVTLDIEAAGALAPGAEIMVYFAPNTTQGFLDAIKNASNDKINRLSIISISWGSSESMWSAQALNSFNQAFMDATARGITVIAASGDNGAADGVADGKAHVDFPASSPYVLSVGGTRIVSSSNASWKEISWDSSGGGVSDVFDLPIWQKRVNTIVGADGRIGRGVPDVSANAEPSSGYRILLHGSYIIVGGTSAAAPFWAGYVAVLNHALGRNLGFLNREIYDRLGPSGAFSDITVGRNSSKNLSGYSAGKGWDAVTGWGTPKGDVILKLLR